jgi:dipeptidase E
MRLLLISNSTNPGGPYLGYPGEFIKDFLGEKPVRALFIPYAAVTFSYDAYEEKVAARFRELGHEIISVHRFPDPAEAVRRASAIVVGGGNSWMLLKMLRDNNLPDIIRERVHAGVPYIGWSAGANIACPTIRTTNDMPVVEPGSFNACGLVPFQINPHYTDMNLPCHAGETREQRIEEFIEANHGIYVAGLREGTMLVRDKESLKLLGQGSIRIFKNGTPAQEFGADEDLSFLLRQRIFNLSK